MMTNDEIRDTKNEIRNTPFVSIIMPIRNEAGFIERAVRSVLDNNYPP